MNNLIQKRRVLKQKLTRMQTFLENVTRPIVHIDLQIRLENLEECYKQFEDIETKIEEICSDEELKGQDSERDAFEEKYFSLKSKLLTLLKPPVTSAVNDVAVQNATTVTSVKLPTLELPNFNGNYQEWMSFFDLFEALVHNNQTLTPVQKLHYLKSSLRGDAARLLFSIPVTDANYSEAWKILTERYHNKRQIVQSHLKSLFSQSTLHGESATGLRRLIDTTVEHTRALHVLDQPTEHWDSVLVHLVVDKLDSDSRRQWELFTPSTDLPRFEDLKIFLEQRCRALEAATSNEVKSKQHASRQTQGTVTARYSTSSYASIKVSCAVCKLNHSIYHCPKFTQATVRERTMLARQHSLCFNCLRTGHGSNQCKSTFCRKCNAKHHTLLHFENSVAESESSVSNTAQSSTSTTVVTHTTHNQDSAMEVLLSTALVKVKDCNGQNQLCRALMDSGSQSSFISEFCAQRLGLQRSKTHVPINGIGNSGTGASRGMVHLEVSSLACDFALTLDALILSKITSQLPKSYICDEEWTHFRTINLADPTYSKPGDIDLLLGADVFAEVMLDGKVPGPRGAPIAQNTVFGWILSGKVASRYTKYTLNNSILSNHVVLDTDSQLRKFWELEEIPRSVEMTVEENQCEAHFMSTHYRDASGSYTVSLPFREEQLMLGYSKKTALNRFNQVQKRLEQFPSKKEQYEEFMNEYISLGHMELIPHNEIVKPAHEVFYLPHHAVMKDTSSTTKLRVVFDGSAKSSTGISINEKLMVGPKLQDNLMNILLRFRLHKFAFTADIEKMYRQIKVNHKDTDFQRIFWKTDPNDELLEFRLTTVTYGTASAPYLAIKTLQQLAKDESTNFPQASMITLQDFYVDDLISGADDQQSALELQSQLINLLKCGGFNLRKWSSNDPSILGAVCGQDHKKQMPFEIDLGTSVKALGLHWHPADDYFSFVVTLSPEISCITKRTILSDICRLFDPLGWLAPSTILAKIIIQKLWLLGVSWDETLPSNVIHEWMQFHGQLKHLEDIQIKRCVTGSGASTTCQIHGFCDASERAYGAAIYMRVTNSEGAVCVNLLCAKTKVAPVKQVSLPRLELCGALLLARLMDTAIKALKLEFHSIFAWTDSTVVLSWITGHPSRWKSFVANRVTEIHELIEPQFWRHVSSDDNPADCASRGLTPTNLIKHELWWAGPSWLILDMASWPTSKWEEDKNALKEFRAIKSIACVSTLSRNVDLLTKFSSLTKLKRVTAYCFRFIQNSKLPKSHRNFGPLTVVELQHSVTFWIKVVQGIEFTETIHNLQVGKSVPSTCRLLSLNPFIDDAGLLRVGGRLQRSSLNYDKKHPILLPKKHYLTDLIISHEHIKNLHAGSQLLLSILQDRFWILNGRDVVRRNIHKCIICFRQRAKTSEQIMGELPSHRLEPARPFLRCGVDYGGPLDIKVSKARGAKRQKSYICLFVCLTTKAIHLELVSDLTTEAFLGALKRFIARRGKCTDIYSDNGTNFIGAKREMAELCKLTRSQHHNDTVLNFLANDNIKWHLIPPGAPHFGGLWEAGIKSVKQHLRRIVGNNILTFEEMYTFLTQIEACLNSRPLIPMSSDPTDLRALTPGHFLIGDSLTSIPEPDLTHLNVNRLSRWQLVQQLSQHFWKRWQNEYLSRLQQRPKWACKRQQINVGDLVLLKEENISRLKWNLARVIETHPGKDGQIRVVSVRTSTGTFKRPIVKICVLPLNS